MRCRDCWAAIKTARSEGKKVCPGCMAAKPLSDYHRSETVRRGPKVVSYCRPCTAEKAKMICQDMPPDKLKAHRRRCRIRNNYGLSTEQFEALLDHQNNKCGICGVEFAEDWTSPAFPRIDHTHDETKAVRGLLCFSCNAGMGSLGDTAERLHAALRYLSAAEIIPAVLATAPPPRRRKPKAACKGA
jgi:hypothetical protein